MSLFCQAAICVMLAPPAVAQSQSFATITIKPARSADMRDGHMQVLPNDDLIARGITVLALVSYAYDVPVNPSRRLLGLPEWHEK